MNKLYTKVRKILNDCTMGEILTVKYLCDMSLQEKLYDIIEQNGGEYVFTHPLSCLFPMDMMLEYVKAKKASPKIKSVLAKKEIVDKTNSIYTFFVKFENDEVKEIPCYEFNSSLISTIIDSIEGQERSKERIKPSKSIFFENEDIIITDPCYIMNDKNSKKKRDDWEKCDYGNNMEVLGIKNYLTRSTIYGDWSCTTYNSDTKEPIGKFCADAGLVSVFSLNEVRNYNPDIDKWIAEHDWCVTTIKNFTGEVYVEVQKEEGVYEDTTKYHKKGEKWEDYSAHVIGKGTTNFITNQTGL